MTLLIHNRVGRDGGFSIFVCSFQNYKKHMYKQTLMFPQRQIIYVTRWYLDTFKKSKIRLQRKLNEYFFVLCGVIPLVNPFHFDINKDLL